MCKDKVWRWVKISFCHIIIPSGHTGAKKCLFVRKGVLSALPYSPCATPKYDFDQQCQYSVWIEKDMMPILPAFHYQKTKVHEQNIAERVSMHISKRVSSDFPLVGSDFKNISNSIFCIEPIHTFSYELQKGKKFFFGKTLRSFSDHIRNVSEWCSEVYSPCAFENYFIFEYVFIKFGRWFKCKYFQSRFQKRWYSGKIWCLFRETDVRSILRAKDFANIKNVSPILGANMDRWVGQQNNALVTTVLSQYARLTSASFRRSRRPRSSFVLNRESRYSKNVPLTCLEPIKSQLYELQSGTSSKISYTTVARWVMYRTWY